jgi:hypothetical protein
MNNKSPSLAIFMVSFAMKIGTSPSRSTFPMRFLHLYSTIARFFLPMMVDQKTQVLPL